MKRWSVFVVIIACVARVQAQDRTPDAYAAALGRAWTALAHGQQADAVRAADEALRINARSHDAIAAKIAALSVADAARALDTYEGWVKTTDDVFLLDPIARGVLASIAAGGDTALQIAALEQLARAGTEAARTRLAELRTKAQNHAAAAALARLGDAAAASKLVETVRSGAVAPDAAPELLESAGSAAVPALRELLKHPVAPVRADAARALGRLGVTDAASDLRTAMADQNPLVSASAAVALTKLGDREGETRTKEMLESELPDFRLMAAEAYVGRGGGPWVNAIMPLLRDPNGLMRFQAAALIAPIDPDAVREVLVSGVSDPNPVIRGEAARVLADQIASKSVMTDLPSVRRLLRDRDPAVRLRAAEIVLGLAAL